MLYRRTQCASNLLLKSDNFQHDIPVLNGVPHGASVLFYIDVEDIDKVYEKINNRVEITKDIETTWYGMREFYIKDCNGYILGFGENKKL